MSATAALLVHQWEMHAETPIAMKWATLICCVVQVALLAFLGTAAFKIPPVAAYTYSLIAVPFVSVFVGAVSAILGYFGSRDLERLRHENANMLAEKNANRERHAAIETEMRAVHNTAMAALHSAVVKAELVFAFLEACQLDLGEWQKAVKTFDESAQHLDAAPSSYREAWTVFEQNSRNFIAGLQNSCAAQSEADQKAEIRKQWLFGDKADEIRKNLLKVRELYQLHFSASS